MKKMILPFVLLFFLQAHTQNNANCNCCSENQKAFDFWIGEWMVTNSTNGTPAGESRISWEEDGCVIRENWTSATPGYTGTSLNFFNIAEQQWEQLWVDNTGAHLKLKGNRVGNQMILTSGEFAKDDGLMYRNRITWTKNDDGTVRQLWEVLQGEKVVSVAFDGLYKKK
ncbi:hypothetical protein F8C76_07765 [Flagellimonas olearia]|uniref:DUF1579 domain-containing protein n=1 Tax=Flagellimonas olearia TaxID=552546 RepID=A0A6I1E653_9FLAO|nr:hypothetical protein [Allomuricauda olearia]KAB7531380.1 hypothetical protein F8C76_07765 [Allomuricauda olearia]